MPQKKQAYIYIYIYIYVYVYLFIYIYSHRKFSVLPSTETQHSLSSLHWLVQKERLNFLPAGSVAGLVCRLVPHHNAGASLSHKSDNNLQTEQCRQPQNFRNEIVISFFLQKSVLVSKIIRIFETHLMPNSNGYFPVVYRTIKQHITL